MAAAEARNDGGLLERELELGLFGELVTGTCAGEGALVVVEAEAGLGKSALLRAVGELGVARGLRVLRARGSELDRAFAFGVVRHLLGREAAEEPGLVRGGAEPAAAMLAPVAGEIRTEEGLFASLQGLHWLVANLAAREPLLLLVDDVQSADTESCAACCSWPSASRTSRRSSSRQPGRPSLGLQALLDALVMAPLARVVRPAPLSASATATVVRARLPEAVDVFDAACYRATGGNPFLLTGGEHHRRRTDHARCPGRRGKSATSANHSGPEQVT